MNRQKHLTNVQETEVYDIVVIGGGASGLGTAVDAATRGFRTALFEANDFAKGTSSKSTKLLHGGVRYLAQGDVALVFEALKERGLLAQNASHLVKKQTFVLPVYSIIGKLWYATGLKIYDWMSRKLSFGSTQILSKDKTVEMLPTIQSDTLKGGILYYDGQFDDARLSINLAQTASENGVDIANYCKVVGLLKEDGKVSGVLVKDVLQQKTYEVRSKVVVNATGVLIDEILQMDNAEAKKSIVPSQGIHLVVDTKFLPSEHALMIPKTTDGRVLFAIPWNGKIIIGTTDTLIKEPDLEPLPLEEEIQFILNNVNQYFDLHITRSDVLSVFVGLRPLKAPKNENQGTKSISRSHKIIVSPSGLVSITGGKWTTYRKIAEDAIDKVISSHNLQKSNCHTETLAIHGNMDAALKMDHPLGYYGNDKEKIERLIENQAVLGEPIHKDYPYVMAQVDWAIDHEMAQTVEDILSRRIRLLFLDARAAKESADKVATFMAKKLGKDQEWKQTQVKQFVKLCEQYILKG